MTNKKSTTGELWSAYVIHMSPKGWLKSNLTFILNKIPSQSNEVYYKVSLCGNFQRQGCSITIPLRLSNGP